MEIKKSRILNQIQGIVPLAYAFMVAIGMLFEYHRYKAFGINIFQYADIFDFLIAPFKDFNIIGALFLITLSMCLGHSLDKFMRKWPKLYHVANFGMSKKSWFDNYVRATFILLIFSLLFYASSSLALRNSNRVKSNNNKVKLLFADNEKMEANLIGKTKEVVFLFSNNQVTIIPSTAFIKKIEFKNDKNFPVKTISQK